MKPAIKTKTYYTAFSRSFQEEDPTDLIGAYFRVAEDLIRNNKNYPWDIVKWNDKTKYIHLRLAQYLFNKDVKYNLIDVCIEDIVSTKKEFNEIINFLKIMCPFSSTG